MDDLGDGLPSQDELRTAVSLSRAMEANVCHQSSSHPENTHDAELHSPAESYKAPNISGDFFPTEEKLRSALADAQLQQGVLQTESSIARSFGEQLLSDALATKVADLLSKPRPQILEADAYLGEANEENDIHWLDLIQESQFEPRCQDNGNYQCRIQKRNALVRISAWDHDLIFTCRQLVYTQTYLSDMLVERDTLEFMARGLSSCNQIASDFIKTNQVTLAQITSRLQPLQEKLKRLTSTLQPPLSGLHCDSASEENSAPKHDERASNHFEESRTTAKEEGWTQHSTPV
ncbi:uncharacterized protein N7511_011356 [Penicillium nucicola]|uniref:uncharacterized protein n=1 Tax=Penicillium nucicola TaxID=1850975 RepID=UPI002544F55C|nr:uncharacterized protein N7511_011356 [Penicillium nucicola]KAJ5742624.1 hypothetical protein N7511_011356 [Penicillium nucicola]